jgi:hypothetical protein
MKRKIFGLVAATALVLGGASPASADVTYTFYGQFPKRQLRSAKRIVQRHDR